MRGFSRSRPYKPDSVEGDHPSLQLPGPSAGSVCGPCLPCTGRGLASRRVATTLVGSYPTFSPLPRRLRREASPVGGLLSVPLSVGFRRLGRPSVLPCGVRTFLELYRPAVTRPASRIV